MRWEQLINDKRLGLENIAAPGKGGQRTDFRRDYDRLVFSSPFRRLQNKTQVFPLPGSVFVHNRLTHSLEVSCVGKSMADYIATELRTGKYSGEPWVNQLYHLGDIVAAACLAHDLGNPPFGHSGESVLNEISETGFHHASHSVRVVTRLEKDGQGLNLTKEVIDGILRHSKGKTGPATCSEDAKPLTVEAQVVRIADLVAYLNHDMDDAIRAGVISKEEFPQEPLKLLGDRHSVRIHTMIKNIVDNSYDSDTIRMSPDMNQATEELKRFLYREVYVRPEIDVAVKKSKNLLRQMADWYNSHPDDLLKNIKHSLPEGQSFNRTLVDYLAGMTDDFALRRFQEIFVPHYYSLPSKVSKNTEL